MWGKNLLTSFTLHEFIEDDLYRIEPVENLRLAAGSDALRVVAFAEVPETDLIEVVQADCASAADSWLAGRRDDLTDVDFEEPEVFYNCHV